MFHALLKQVPTCLQLLIAMVFGITSSYLYHYNRLFKGLRQHEVVNQTKGAKML